jgi:hypothetical protein
MIDPASIRTNNPGAMWGKGNALATKWGATASPTLNDGLGQGNNIAVFPDKIHGAAAQFDLWHTSEHYHNKTLTAAIHTWSGGNSSSQYVEFLIKHAPGLTAMSIINDALLSSPLGIAMMKAQAWNEAGKPYPMTDEEWKQAQSLVFGGIVNVDQAAINAPKVVPTQSGIVRVGDSGAEVLKLQKLLWCKETGAYSHNSETEFALKLFQVRKGLTPDGVCGALTWEKLQPKV